MDTVIGHAGGKSILTMDFTFCNFMLGFLLEDKTSLEVTEKLKGSNQDLSERDCASASSFRWSLPITAASSLTSLLLKIIRRVEKKPRSFSATHINPAKNQRLKRTTQYCSILFQKVNPSMPSRNRQSIWSFLTSTASSVKALMAKRRLRCFRLLMVQTLLPYWGSVISRLKRWFNRPGC